VFDGWAHVLDVGKNWPLGLNTRPVNYDKAHSLTGASRMQFVGGQEAMTRGQNDAVTWVTKL
jgi:hypothetical protein